MDHTVHAFSNFLLLPEDGPDSRRHLPDPDVVKVGLGDLGPLVHGSGKVEVHLGCIGDGRVDLTGLPDVNTQQNIIPRPPTSNQRKGRDQILQLSVAEPHFL